MRRVGLDDFETAGHERRKSFVPRFLQALGKGIVKGRVLVQTAEYLLAALILWGRRIYSAHKAVGRNKHVQRILLLVAHLIGLLVLLRGLGLFR